MKNKTIPIIFLALTLIIAANFPIYSQTSDSKTVSKTETISFLIEQTKNDRALIEKQDARISDLEAENSAEKENSASISKSYDSAKSEIVNLKTSNAALARAVAINEDTIAKLQTDNAVQKEKAKNAEKTKWKVIAVAAGVIALKFILP